MNLSPKFTELAKGEEGFRPNMYLDMRGLPTIGYGTLIDSAKLDYLKEATITTVVGEQLLLQKAEPIEELLNNLIGHGLKINQNQFDALADFCYNCGRGAFLSSTLLKTIMKNPNDFSAIKFQLLRWDKSIVDGRTVEVSDLKQRRLNEFKLYSSI